MDTKIEELVVSFLEGELDPEQANRLAMHLEAHAADREEFLALAGQARAMAVLLSPRTGFSASVLSEIRARSSGGRFVGEVLARLPRRSRRLRQIVALAAAASVLLAVGVAVWLADGDKTPAPTVALAAGWRVQPTGSAVYRVVTPNRLRLDRGELFVEAAAQANGRPPRPTLNIETPAGTAAATGTKFYIGVHTRSSHRKGTPMKPFTRVLVLAGAVALSNSLGSVTGQANDLLAADAGQAPTKLAVKANSDFAFDLYKQLAKENAGRNMFFSPYSISSALAMTAEGARGQTALEMGKVLRFPKAARRVGDDAQLIPWHTALIHTGMAELNTRLVQKDNAAGKAIRAEIAKLRKQHETATQRVNELRKQRKWDESRKVAEVQREITRKLNELLPQVDQYELRIANALWGEKTYPFLDAYINTISKHYKTGGVFPADFKRNFPAERLRINKWVEEQTNNRIKDLIPELRPAQARLVRLILTNAIFFKGEWSVPFKEADTKPREFTLAGGDRIDTPTMRAPNLEVARYAAFNADGSFFETPAKVNRSQRTELYPDKDGFAMLEMPYRGDDLSMVLLAPNAADGLATIEKKLTPANLAVWIAKLRKRKTHVFLPKFKLETAYKMKETLQAMGMVRAFTDPFAPNGADFTGMCASEDPRKRLYISRVLHKAFAEVNEKGTEGAAATAVIMPPAEAEPPRTVPFTPTFKADRPFVFVIGDVKTGSILFLGRMMNPKE